MTLVVTLDTGAFKDCRGLTTVNLPSTLKTIGPIAFYGCESLKNVTVPEGIENVKSAAFKNCIRLEKAELPYGMAEVSSNLFAGCKKLADVILPVTVTNIAANAFDGCSQVTITGMNRYTEDYAEGRNIDFQNGANKYNGLFYAVHDNEAVITGSYNSIFSLVIPEEIKGNKVVGIWAKAFKDDLNVTNVTLPSTISYIGEDAFKNCLELLEVTNYSGLNIECKSEKNGYIGCYAWNVRKNADDGQIVTTDDKGFIFACFEGKTYLVGYEGDETKPVLPDLFPGMNEDSGEKYYIYKYAFAGNKSLTSCSISSKVTFIGNNAFYKCKNLSSVYITANVNKIGSDAFAGCSENFRIEGFKNTYAQTYAKENGITFKTLTDPKVPTGIVKSMVSLQYKFAEWHKNGRKPKVTVKSGDLILKENKDYTVKYKNAKKVGTASVTVTGKGNYTGSVTMEYKIKVLVNHSYKTSDYEVRITKVNSDGKTGTATIKKYLGNNKDVTIDNTVDIGGLTLKVTGIGRDVFSQSSSVSSVTLGKYVQRIENGAFYGCKKLKSIVIESEVVNTVGSVAVKNIYKKAVIKVPAAKYTEYKKLFLNQTGFYKPMKITKI